MCQKLNSSTVRGKRGREPGNKIQHEVLLGALELFCALSVLVTRKCFNWAHHSTNNLWHRRREMGIM